MSIEKLNEVRAITRAARAVGAVLPQNIQQAIDHLEQLRATAPTPIRPAVVAAELALLLGAEAALEKARTAAADELSRSEARAKIDALLPTALGSRLRSLMRADADPIAACFGEALASDITTLADEAGKLPALFRPERADTLSASGFTAWTRARDAWQRISATGRALDFLYPTVEKDVFPGPAQACLRVAEPPAFTDPSEAYAFRNALLGRGEQDQGLASQGSAIMDGLFVPTAIAHAGGSFAWAGPAEVGERARRTVEAMVARPAPVVAPPSTVYAFR